MKRLVLVPVALVFGLASCTSAPEEPDQASLAAAEASPAPVVFNESDVRDHLKMRGDFFRTPGGVKCEVAVVMTDAASVAMYADAGDVVATNPDHTAGVKIVAVEAATCLKAGNNLLTDFGGAR